MECGSNPQAEHSGAWKSILRRNNVYTKWMWNHKFPQINRNIHHRWPLTTKSLVAQIGSVLVTRVLRRNGINVGTPVPRMNAITIDAPTQDSRIWSCTRFRFSGQTNLCWRSFSHVELLGGTTTLSMHNDAGQAPGWPTCISQCHGA